MEIRIKIHKTYIIDRHIHSLKDKITKGCEQVDMDIQIANGEKIHCSALMPINKSNVIKVYNIEKRKSIRRRSDTIVKYRSDILGDGYEVVREPRCIAYIYYIPLSILSSAGLSVEQKTRHFVFKKAGAPIRK